MVINHNRANFCTWVWILAGAAAYSTGLWSSFPSAHPRIHRLALSLRTLLQLFQEISQSSVTPRSGNVQWQAPQWIRNCKSSWIPLVKHKCCLCMAQSTSPHLWKTKRKKENCTQTVHKKRCNQVKVIITYKWSTGEVVDIERIHFQLKVNTVGMLWAAGHDKKREKKLLKFLTYFVPSQKSVAFLGCSPPTNESLDEPCITLSCSQVQ